MLSASTGLVAIKASIPLKDSEKGIIFFLSNLKFILVAAAMDPENIALG